MQIECPVCLEVMVKPYIIKCCRNNICSSCISRLDKCPLCRDDINNKYTLNTSLQESISKLDVYCCYHKEGCYWTGYLTSRSDHVRNNCQFLRLKCGYDWCQWAGPRRDRPRHVEACIKTRLKELQGTITSLTQENERLKTELARFKTSSTSKVNTASSYASKVNAAASADSKPVSKATPSVSSKVLNLNCQTVIGYIESRIDDYDDFEGNPFYLSHPGYKIQLLVSFNDPYVELSIRFVSGKYDNELKWPFTGSITVELVNMQGGDNHEHLVEYDRYSNIECRMIRPYCQYSGAWGTDEFISTDDLWDVIDEDEDRAILKVTRVEFG